MTTEHDLGPLVERLLKYSDIRRNDPRENREALRELIVSELSDLLNDSRSEVQRAVEKERERCALWLSTQRNDVPATGREFAEALRLWTA